jgi:hypothetical protein
MLHAPTAALSTVTHLLYRSNSGAPSRPHPQGGFLLLAQSDQESPLNNFEDYTIRRSRTRLKRPGFSFLHCLVLADCRQFDLAAVQLAVETAPR